MKILITLNFIFLIFWQGFAFAELPSDIQIQQIVEFANNLRPESTDDLADGQAMLMLPSRYAFMLHDSRLEKPLLDTFLRFLRSQISLEQLRTRSGEAGRYDIDPVLLDAKRSGPGTRAIFPTNDSFRRSSRLARAALSDNQLMQLEFTFLMSSVVRYIAQDDAIPSDVKLEFLSEATQFLHSSIVYPFWRQIQAWHWGGTFPNMQTRAEARLSWFAANRRDIPKYYMAFHDADQYYFGICANLSASITGLKKAKIEVAPEDKQVIEEVLDVALRVFKQRTSATGGFDYQAGLWSDHPEFRHAACLDSLVAPTSDCLSDKVAMDTSHSHRLPWILESLYAASSARQDGSTSFYRDMLARLGRHLTHNIVEYTPQGLPLLRNFFSGENGWFRVGYEDRPWGYAPYMLSATASHGSWYLLAAYEPSVNKFVDAMCRMTGSSDPNAIAHRTKYFGRQRAIVGKPTSWRSVDLLGESSTFNSICAMTYPLLRYGAD